MDYFKDAEERLKKYSNASQTLDNLKLRLERIKLNGPKDIKAVDYSKIGKSNFSRDALNELVEAQHITRQIVKLESEVLVIDKILEQIKEKSLEQYKFINLRYVENKNLDKVAADIGYSSNSKHTIYTLRDNALKSFVTLYWGE